MAKIVYGKRDTATVVSIEKAPQSIQTLWNASNVLGVNIVRVRANKERYETTAGDTFNGYHAGRVSIYQQKPNPRNPLHFVRRTPLGKDNKGMQILEVATNIDVQDTLGLEFEVKNKGMKLTRISSLGVLKEYFFGLKRTKKGAYEQLIEAGVYEQFLNNKGA